MKQLGQNYSVLKMTESRFKESRASLGYIKKGSEKKESLIPLTSSLYAPGKLTQTDTVMIDIGTGYFVKKSVADAMKFFDRKVKL